MRVWYCTLVLNEALLFCTRRCDGVLSIISYNWSIFVSNGWLVSSNQSNSVVCSIRDESVEYLRNCSHMCRACLYRVQKERLCLICSYLMKKWGLHSYKYQKNMSICHWKFCFWPALHFNDIHIPVISDFIVRWKLVRIDLLCISPWTKTQWYLAFVYD